MRKTGHSAGLWVIVSGSGNSACVRRAKRDIEKGRYTPKARAKAPGSIREHYSGRITSEPLRKCEHYSGRITSEPLRKCEHYSGRITSEPLGKCEHCVSVKRGCSPSLPSLTGSTTKCSSMNIGPGLEFYQELVSPRRSLERSN